MTEKQFSFEKGFLKKLYVYKNKKHI